MITSIKNEKIKELLSLKEDRNFLFLDSPKLIEEAKIAGLEFIYVIYRGEVSEKIDYGPEAIIVGENVFKKFTNTMSSQGVVVIIKNNLRNIEKPKGYFLVLDNVQDPGNVGTLIRSAAGAGFNDVYLIDCASLSNDKTIRSSMGAVFKINVFEICLEEFIKAFTKWDLFLYAADMFGEDIYKSCFNKCSGLVVGNEGSGIREDIKKIINKTLSVPMQNNLESLNVAVGGSVIMYQMAFSESLQKN